MLAAQIKQENLWTNPIHFKAYTLEHKITNEAFNDKFAQRQTRRQFIHMATSADEN